jgi:acetoin utilization deacetylase AcuC-like enzyme
MRALEAAVEAAWQRLGTCVDRVPPIRATTQDLKLVHTAEHVERVREAVEMAGSRDGLVALDPDTRVSAGSWEAALDAVGAAVTAVDLVGGGRYRNAFVAARPPGHHATPDRAMGFCLFNNAAIAARWLQRRAGVSRVLVVDWDVHHGNGTQDAFEDDPTVCYLSLHQWPHYPGTGRATDEGSGRGRGLTVNVPLAPATDPREYHERFEEALDRVSRRFTPDFVLVSAGFDVMAEDPLGGQLLEPEDLARLTRGLLERSRSWCDGRMVTLLEGGYVPDRVGAGAVAVLEELSSAPARPGTTS